ncbi:CHASE2 domain-containing protein [Aphanothece stagnina]|uniref:CHASE2 domain-containing protein n=1 Tax=Aphanothece stagnina TaxID=1004305 RepID=UPI00398F8C26
MVWSRRHVAFLIWAAICGIGLWAFPQYYQRWQLSLVTRAQELRGVRQPPRDVVILAIDDFSLIQGQNADLSTDPLLQSLTSWPWPRSIYTSTLDRLFGSGAKAVAFDILFDSPSSHGEADDAAFAKGLQRYRDKVVLGAQVFESRGRVGGLTLSSPLPMLAAAAGSESSGLLNGLQDDDGYIRLRPSSYAQQLRQSELPEVPSGLATGLIRKGGLPERPPLVASESWRRLLDLYGPARTITTIPIWEVLEADSFKRLADRGDFRNRVVLIGPTASVLQDIHRTAFAGAEGMPGVEIHATEIANRLEGRALFVPPASRLWGLFVGVLVLLLGLLSARSERPQVRLGSLALLGAAMLGSGLLLLNLFGLGIGLLGLSVVTLATGLVSAGDATVRLQLSKLRLRRMLGRYLSPAVAAQMATQPEEADEILGGRVFDVVIFISDVRGFTNRTTAMTQANQVPELVDQLNEYFGMLVTVLQREGATIDKYMGDSVLAVFGAPMSRGIEEEVNAALRAVFELQHSMEALNQRWQEAGKEQWEQVMVLAAGPVISGNIGCASRMDFTVIGDTVNMASRLEGVAKQTNSAVVLSSRVASLAAPEWTLASLGQFELRGQGTQDAFTLKGHSEGGEPAETNGHGGEKG